MSVFGPEYVGKNGITWMLHKLIFHLVLKVMVVAGYSNYHNTRCLTRLQSEIFRCNEAGICPKKNHGGKASFVKPLNIKLIRRKTVQ